MAYSIPTTEPASLRAGDTAQWTKSLPDFPASEGWTLSYDLVSATVHYTFNASASGDNYSVTVTAATTSGWTAGEYQWAAKVSKAGEVHEVASGAIVIKPSFGAAVDARSHARKTLDAIEAWIENRDIGVAEYEVNGRRLKAIPIEQLLVLRDRYRREVRAEDDAARAAAGLPSRNKLLVRFGRPS